MAPANPIDSEYSFLRHGHGRTHYHKSGKDSGPVVVMVCGATLPLAVWEPLMAPLTDLGYQVIRYDLPGRGHTPLAGFGPDFQAHIDQLGGLLAGLGIGQQVRMIGLASGALIVAAFADRHPGRVSHAGLIAPDGVSTRFTLSERLLSTPAVGTLLFRFTARRTLLARVPRYSSRADIQAFVRDLLEFSLRSPGFHEAVLATVRTFPLHHGEALYLKLAKSGVPTCIIRGGEDHITPPNAAGDLFGKGSLHVLRDVGHLPFAEDPATVAALLESHFQKKVPGSFPNQ